MPGASSSRVQARGDRPSAEPERQQEGSAAAPAGGGGSSQAGGLAAGSSSQRPPSGGEARYQLTVAERAKAAASAGP